MRTAFMCLLLTASVFGTSSQLLAQDAYRTNVKSNVAQWTNATTWQRFDAVKNDWVNADHFPTSADGVITIQPGDSIQVAGADAAQIMIDQVVISRGASLVFMYNKDGAVLLNDGEGDDMIVNGHLSIASEGALRGSGRIQVNDGASFTLKNDGLLSATLHNNGTIYLGAVGQASGIFMGSHIVNNDTLVWVDGNLLLDSATTFLNNGRMVITPLSGNLICTNNKLHPAKIINKGVIVNKGKDFTVDFKVKVDNQGTIGGVGTFLFSGGVNSGGVISPGASPGHLTVGPGSLRSAMINIEIATNGAIAGTNYDQLSIASLHDLAGATINIANVADDSVNTEYTIIEAKTGMMGKRYPDVKINAPSNFSTFFNGNRLIVKKIAAHPLPVSWGGFKAVANGNKVLLDWNAAADTRTAYFIVEYSTDGTSYRPVGKIDARMEEAEEIGYSFTFPAADVLKTNYFRIKQVNKDGRSGYSAPRTIRFDKGTVVVFQAHADVETNELQLNIQAENVKVCLNDANGKALQEFAFQPGQHSIDMESLPSGMYRVNVFVNDVMVEMKQVMRQ